MFDQIGRGISPAYFPGYCPRGTIYRQNTEYGQYRQDHPDDPVAAQAGIYFCSEIQSLFI